MAVREGGFTAIDQNIAANVRTYREAGRLSQEELAQRMTDRGFSFTQATIWKIESGQRPVRASELVALADALGGVRVTPTALTYEPDAAKHRARLERAHTEASAAYHKLKDAAAGYLDAQLGLLVAAYEAREAGVAVTELHSAWLDVPAEEAVIEARIDSQYEEEQALQKIDAVKKVLDALRAAGYKGTLSLDDIEVHGGPAPEAAPPQPGGTS
jgi:transcriptional regulator with XRE-family HTH domain